MAACFQGDNRDGSHLVKVEKHKLLFSAVVPINPLRNPESSTGKSIKERWQMTKMTRVMAGNMHKCNILNILLC